MMNSKAPRWTTSEECLLARLRSQYPHYTWEDLTIVFNEHLPPERWRTRDAVKNKSAKLRPFLYEYRSSF